MSTTAASGDELGPFKNDGPFVRQVLTEMASLTNQSFSFGNVEAVHLQQRHLRVRPRWSSSANWWSANAHFLSRSWALAYAPATTVAGP
jgi:hypothetical protein